MKKITLLTFLILISISCKSQDRIVEKTFNDCYFNSMPNQGKELKIFHNEYESLLISNGILIDNSGESYYNLFKKIMRSEISDTKTNFSFIDSINKLSYTDLIHSNQKCSDKIKSLDIYKDSNTYRFEKTMDSLNDPYNDKIVVIEKIISSLNEKDFELDFYKIRALLIMERMNSISDLFEEKVYSEKQLETAFKVLLTKKNEIIFQGKKVSNDNLKILVENYLRIAKKNSLIIIDTYRDVKYGDYVKFIKSFEYVFSKLRNELSEQKFNKQFENLTESEKEIIEKEYSFEIKENTPE
jgi:hypothetical protein